MGERFNTNSFRQQIVLGPVISTRGSKTKSSFLSANPFSGRGFYHTIFIFRYFVSYDSTRMFGNFQIQESCHISTSQTLKTHTLSPSAHLPALNVTTVDPDILRVGVHFVEASLIVCSSIHANLKGIQTSMTTCFPHATWVHSGEGWYA